eukprot:maker-scaffold122_size333723-snap-gene-0.22 protein:Tk04111 transcript:maker-scaffold122_size333723-snap-gene-0.22-mRNA-1 annotation:"hypothetical protein EMIHUDRAFT_315231"
MTTKDDLGVSQLVMRSNDEHGYMSRAIAELTLNAEEMLELDFAHPSSVLALSEDIAAARIHYTSARGLLSEASSQVMSDKDRKAVEDKTAKIGKDWRAAQRLFTQALSLLPAGERRPAQIKVQSAFKPDTLTKDSSPVVFRQWISAFKFYYETSNIATMSPRAQKEFLYTCLDAKLKGERGSNNSGVFQMRFHRRPKFCKKQSSDAILNRPLPIPQGPTLKSDEEEESVPSGGLVVPKSLTTTPESRELVAQILRHNLPPSKLFQNDWNTIIGHEEAKLALEELVILPFQHPELYSKCGLGHGTKSILLSGPPGTGKTSLVRCLASQAKFQFFNLSSSALVSKWRGDSEKLISIVFEVARHNSPSIVFLDEAESILGNRLINMEHEASKRQVQHTNFLSKSELLVQLDGLHEDQRPVLFVASTNMPWCLDPGFVRRFSRILKVGLPSQEERSQIIRNQFQSTQWNLDLAAIQNQTEGFS